MIKKKVYLGQKVILPLIEDFSMKALVYMTNPSKSPNSKANGIQFLGSLNFITSQKIYKIVELRDPLKMPN